MTKTEQVNNELSQAERRAELLKSGAGSTFQQFATGEADPGHNRYSELEKFSTITGTPAQKYPPQPAGSPWASDPVGPEPPLGFSVDEMIPAGEAFEIEKSLRERFGDLDHSTQVADGASPSGGAEAPALAPIHEPSETASPPSHRKRRR